MRRADPKYPRLAFVDIETTGLGHTRQRIAEIGVVTVDDNGVDEWTALLDPGRRIATDEEFGPDAEYTSHRSGTGLPRFADIAGDLAKRLAGRLFVAHNARFDYAFVRAELRRAGIDYAAPALCTMMLSRKLHPEHAVHHLDALIERHQLDRVERHRALPDARALFQFWQVLARDVPRRRLDKSIGELLAGPLLPEHLDRAMIDALPERPGVFVLEDHDGNALHIGRATNLRRQVTAYFRVDRQCARAGDHSHRVAAIRGETADGPVDARLIEIARRRALSLPTTAARRSMVTIRIDPEAEVVATTEWLADCDPDTDRVFGLYASERRARNALKKIASKRGICATLIGLPRSVCPGCIGAADTGRRTPCVASRKHDLVRLFTAIAPSKLPSWPYRGPIAVREGRKVHVFDRWTHLGSVRAMTDVPRLLEQRPSAFDADIYVVLVRELPKIARKSIRVLERNTRSAVGNRALDPAEAIA